MTHFFSIYTFLQSTFWSLKKTLNDYTNTYTVCSLINVLVNVGFWLYTWLKSRDTVLMTSVIKHATIKYELNLGLSGYPSDV